MDIIDISSDDDSDIENEFTKFLDFYLSEEEESDGHIETVNELSYAKMASKQNSGAFDAKKDPLEDDSDDEVLVWEKTSDPVKNFNDWTDESDELLIVGEKGQVACRDYPHARHLCAQFPFHRTPHEDHCKQCHCYVCDLPAPCKYWGSGISSSDHCHSTDKEEKWRSKRNNIKSRRTIPQIQQSSYETPASHYTPKSTHLRSSNISIRPNHLHPFPKSHVSLHHSVTRHQNKSLRISHDRSHLLHVNLPPHVRHKSTLRDKASLKNAWGVPFYNSHSRIRDLGHENPLLRSFEMERLNNNQIYQASISEKSQPTINHIR